MLNILIIMNKDVKIKIYPVVGPVPRAPVALLLESAIADGAQRGNM